MSQSVIRMIKYDSQSHEKVHFVAVLELSIILQELPHQMKFPSCRGVIDG